MKIEEWLTKRREAGRGINPELPDELRSIGREHFACAPGSEIWGWFGDLSQKARDRLRLRMEHSDVTGTWSGSKSDAVLKAELKRLRAKYRAEVSEPLSIYDRFFL